MIQIYTDFSGQYHEYDQIVRLEGSDFRLKLSWNERMGFWILSLYAADGEAIVEGAPVITGTDLLRGYVSAQRPRGQLFSAPFDTKPDHADLTDLGSRVALLYEESV